MPLSAGLATSEGTARFRARALSRKVPSEHFRHAPTGPWVSSLGLGTYIGPPDGSTDLAVEQAVRVALSSRRVNVVDTAINYRYQRAERSLGRALLAEFSRRDGVRRDEVFVSTKAGYFAPDGESEIPVDEWVERELIAKGVLDVESVVDGCHSMSVPYLRDQFERSRKNLGLESLDLFYLHNAGDAQLRIVGAEEFRRRIADAFTFLEELKSAGWIGAYGLATWDCLRAARGSPGYLGLETLLAVARQVGGETHGFRYVQFPFNSAMPEAALLRNQGVNGDRVTLFEAAQRFGLGCFTSVPLYQGQLARHGPSAEGLTPAQSALQLARSVPGNLGPLVGQKQPAHLSENLKVAEMPFWDAAQVAGMLSR